MENEFLRDFFERNRNGLKLCNNYKSIYRNKNKYPIKTMCNFFCVSRSGYYDFLKRLDKSNEDEIIAKLIMKCQKITKYTYSYRRVKFWLLYKTRLVINHKAVLRIMNKYGLLSEVR